MSFYEAPKECKKLPFGELCLNLPSSTLSSAAARSCFLNSCHPALGFIAHTILIGVVYFFIFWTIKHTYHSALSFRDTVLLGMQSVKESKVHLKRTPLSLCYVTILLVDGDIPETAPAAWLWAAGQKWKGKATCGLNLSSAALRCCNQYQELNSWEGWGNLGLQTLEFRVCVNVQSLSEIYGQADRRNVFLFAGCIHLT